MYDGGHNVMKLLGVNLVKIELWDCKASLSFEHHLYYGKNYSVV